MPLYAHIDEFNPSRKEPLIDHLSLVEKYARIFGSEFSSGELAAAVAKVHDFGKCSTAFQEYLLSSTKDTATKGPDHSSAGAQFLDNSQNFLPGIGRLLAYAAAGHHAGLPNGIEASQSSLENRLKKTLEAWESIAHQELPPHSFSFDKEAIKKEITPFLKQCDGYTAFFLVRMLFSCLVDADYIATEEFMDGEKSRLRIQESTTMPELLAALQTYYARFRPKDNAPLSPVNQIRTEVMEDCIASGSKPQGLFTLTVPTGGGKTLSSMYFALTHAIQNGMKRILYVIPYTSIIEQNANVFRSVFGDDPILEHHCNFDFESCSPRMKLLAENWNSPITITTSVQFFESLHANRTSRCRKLHNLANSVIILDEAQSLPTNLLLPCLRALDELVSHYHSSVVLCTATQPAVLKGQLQKGGLENKATEIIAPNRNLHERLKRVQATHIHEPLSDDDLLTRLEDFPSALVIVNTTRHARALFQKTQDHFPNDITYHLSAKMCPVHRFEVLNQIKENLRQGIPCRVIATQLVEAGVDIDFPCVFRAMSGVDSMIQAAGRCNRNGALDHLGQVFLFESQEYKPPKGFLRTAAQYGSEIIGLDKFQADILSPATTFAYFELLYAQLPLDEFHVLSERIPKRLTPTLTGLLECQFKTLGEEFHFIENQTRSVFVPYGEEGFNLCEQLRNAFSPSEQRAIARKLQRYSVNLFDYEIRDPDGHLIIEQIHEVYWILSSTSLYYDPKYGINRIGNNIDLDMW